MENEPSRLHSTHSRSFMLFTCNLLIIIHVELPPAKWRRTLAGSIVSTALSAAQIGTAFGLTVYRLCILNLIRSPSLFAQPCLSWRDRGKLPDQPPHLHLINAVTGLQMLPNHVSRPSPHRLSRRVSPVRPHHLYGAPSGVIAASLVQDYRPSLLSTAYLPHIPLLNRDSAVSACTRSSQMDWMGDRLTCLIQEGQKALGREIVVMSDAKEVEVDDGSNDWEEKQDNKPVPPIAAPSISHHGSVRSRRWTHKPCDITLLPSYPPYPMSPPNSVFPWKCHFEPGSVHRTPGRSTREGYIAPSTPSHTPHGTSAESDALAHIVPSSKEDKSAWQSPELCKSMEQTHASCCFAPCQPLYCLSYCIS
ncbi:hypothetical protein HD554DRAFT_572626 [Boletus coccyginus]|nr:hypothetical protein HD554DRAFT_572626 [Boletus coccyginus]